MADDKTKTILGGVLAVGVIAGAIALGTSEPSAVRQTEIDRITSAERADLRDYTEIDRANSVGGTVRVKVRRDSIPTEADRMTSVSPSTKDAAHDQ